MKNIMKSLLILSCSICVGLSGCGKKEKGPAVISISYSYWTGKDTASLFPKIAEDFNRLHPGIRVKFIPAPVGQSGTVKLLTQIAAGTAPDVFGLYSTFVPEFAARGMIMPLEPLAGKDAGFDLDAYHPAGIECFRYKDILLGLPWDLSTDALMYNKDVFDEAGVSYPDENWTWDDLLAAAKRMTRDKDGDGRTDSYGIVFGSILFYFVRANRGEFFDKEFTHCTLDSPEAKEALRFYCDLLLKHKVVPSQSAMMNQTLDEDISLWFPHGKAGMMTGGVYVKYNPGFNSPSLRWDAAPMPLAHKGAKRVTPVYCNGYVINSRTKYPEAAWEFLKYITGAEGAAPWLKITKALPALKSLSNAPDIISPPPEHIQVFWDALDYAEQMPRIPGWRRYFDGILVMEIQNYLSGAKSFDRFIMDTVNGINKAMAEERNR